jgi:hypothetical protein
MLQRAAALLPRLWRPEAYDRLLKALSLIYGIESSVVVREIWGASYREVEAVARRMLESALRRAPPTGKRGTRSLP